MADYTHEQLVKKEARKAVSRIIASLISTDRDITDDEMEELMFAWAVDRDFFRGQTETGRQLAIAVAGSIGGGIVRKMAILMTMANFDKRFATFYPDMHRAKTGAEQKIFKMVISFLNAMSVVFGMSDGSLSIPAQALIHLCILQNYDRNVDIFCRYSSGAWMLTPVLMRELILSVRDENGVRERKNRLTLGMAAASYYEREGMCYTIRQSYTERMSEELTRMFEPFEWVRFLFESRHVLDNMARTAPDQAQIVWIEAAKENLNMLMIVTARRNVLPPAIIFMRSALSRAESSDSDDQGVVEALERTGLFAGDTTVKEVPKLAPEKMKPLSLKTRNALLDKMKSRLQAGESLSSVSLHEFTTAVHTEFGPDCETCMSAPKQVIYKECGHVFMCEKCFTGGYERSSECPVCRTQSKTVFLLTMSSNEAAQSSQS